MEVFITNSQHIENFMFLGSSKIQKNEVNMSCSNYLITFS